MLGGQGVFTLFLSCVWQTKSEAFWGIRPGKDSAQRVGGGGCASLGPYFNKALSLRAAKRHVATPRHPKLSLSALTKGYQSPSSGIITKIILSIMMLVSQEC